MADTEPLELWCSSRLHNRREPGGKLLPILAQKGLLQVGGKKDTRAYCDELKNLQQVGLGSFQNKSNALVLLASYGAQFALLYPLNFCL